MSGSRRKPFNPEQHTKQRLHGFRTASSSIRIFDGGEAASLQNIQLSEDGRRRNATVEQLELRTQPIEDFTSTTNFNDDHYIPEDELIELASRGEKLPAKRYALSVRHFPCRLNCFHFLTVCFL